MYWLHHSWHHHVSGALHRLRHLRDCGVPHSHHLLVYILHHHLRTRRNSHKILLACTRHHHLRILIAPHSWMSHSSSNHLLLLHHIDRHGISSIWTLGHITRMTTHWHRRSWHHRGCLMRHRSLLLSKSLLSKFCLAMSERATFFVWTILS